MAFLALINIIIAIGLNLLIGNAGQICCAPVLFHGDRCLRDDLSIGDAGAELWVALPAGGCLSGVFGLILGVPALRLQGFYLAVVTLGFLE